MLFDKVIAFDSAKQKIILIANMNLSDPETGYNKAVMEIEHMCDLLVNGEEKKEAPGRLLGEVTAALRREALL